MACGSGLRGSRGGGGVTADGRRLAAPRWPATAGVGASPAASAATRGQPSRQQRSDGHGDDRDGSAQEGRRRGGCRGVGVIHRPRNHTAGTPARHARTVGRYQRPGRSDQGTPDARSGRRRRRSTARVHRPGQPGAPAPSAGRRTARPARPPGTARRPRRSPCRWRRGRARHSACTFASVTVATALTSAASASRDRARSATMLIVPATGGRPIGGRRRGRADRRAEPDRGPDRARRRRRRATTSATSTPVSRPTPGPSRPRPRAMSARWASGSSRAYDMGTVALSTQRRSPIPPPSGPDEIASSGVGRAATPAAGRRGRPRRATVSVGSTANRSRRGRYAQRSAYAGRTVELFRGVRPHLSRTRCA